LEDFISEYRLSLDGCDEVQNTPLHWAAFVGNARTVQELLKTSIGTRLLSTRNKAEMGPDIHQYSVLAGGGATPLMLAAEKGVLEVVKALLDARAEVNTVASYGATALNLASTRQHADCVRALLACRAQVDIALNEQSKFFGNCNGFTALHSAAIKGSEEIVRLCCQAGQM